MEREIDWSKPLEVFLNGEWIDVIAIMKDSDGNIVPDRTGEIMFLTDSRTYKLQKSHKIRNKPEKLVLWVNEYPNGDFTGYRSYDRALKNSKTLTNPDRIAVRMVEADDD